MIQVIEGLEIKGGVQVRHLVKIAGGTFWSVKLPCGHKQLARHSDLIAEITPVCNECSKAISVKANGVESDEQFRQWSSSRSLKPARAKYTPIAVEIEIDESDEEFGEDDEKVEETV